jgi:hypothetical protein
MKAAPGAPRRAAASFGRVLEDVESAHAFADGLGRPLEIPLPFEEARSEEAGAAWDQALAFVEDTVGPPQAETDASAKVHPGDEPQPSTPLSDDPQAIAAELGLADAASLADLQHARRRFMWANHPDRRLDVAPALANRRGAIANMLIDQAEAALAASPARRQARR